RCCSRRSRCAPASPDLGVGCRAMEPTIRVRAPATSANLGPAFDAAGIALDWWDELEVRPAPVDAIQVSGEQAELLPTGRDNLVAVAMRRLAEAAGAPLPPLHLAVVKGFPLGRGFGSSAAAVVLGLVAARRLVAPGLPDTELLALACELEGHPDNATPCLQGGATLARVQGAPPPRAPRSRWRPARPGGCCPSGCRSRSPPTPAPARPCSPWPWPATPSCSCLRPRTSPQRPGPP